ncbi:glycosyltransferase family 90 protein [Aplosporella prunicola CBS 121167]|uniref:Glycosyltransferase family 90 protein n=1 Tax=Aplosporella prunicola CBS 121167 TaxID=1176127 RepID=A0A6A6B4T4_9PEZI|nr:glycosyltransferase family 90 protein [Aplosporella prunicola CBS 121167]KAF2139040.1 glycosyltransferase family 90 protein [Aplosporella prunicola CBS 121167]
MTTRFSHLRFLAAAVILTCATWLLLHQPSPDALLPSEYSLQKPQSPHPIKSLIAQGQAEWKKLLDKETSHIGAAASAYRKRRGRHPPPGFDAWFDFARNRSAVIVEDFFDQIYHDLEPFWGASPAIMRAHMKAMEQVISVRDGTVSIKTDKERVWMDLWGSLTQEIAHLLPDLDMGINVMDESRVMVPWEVVNEHMEKARQTRGSFPNATDVESAYESLPALEQNALVPMDPGFKAGKPYWDFVRAGCPPNTPGRKAAAVTDFSGLPPLPVEASPQSHMGFVSNWTWARDPCGQPELRELHGNFVEPISISTSTRLLPMFSGSKLPMNNDILLPPAMYWTHDPFYSGGDEQGPPWDQKSDSLIWRGDASGGRNRESNWRRFHRHRLLSMLNGSTVAAAETPDSISSNDDDAATAPQNFALPVPSAYPQAQRLATGTLGPWLSSFADARFISLICFPTIPSVHCNYTEPYFAPAASVPMQQQYQAKYLPDVDGNSFSGRYRSFLRSTSVPLKATIYSEWHDSRLVPWAHFVPLHNSFVDVYGVLEFFVGAQVGRGRDDLAKRIADDGREWADKVLRHDDMLIYVYRLLLEWARVMDERRDALGWVRDLVEAENLAAQLGHLH